MCVGGSAAILLLFVLIESSTLLSHNKSHHSGRGEGPPLHTIGVDADDAIFPSTYARAFALTFSTP